MSHLLVKKTRNVGKNKLNLHKDTGEKYCTEGWEEGRDLSEGGRKRRKKGWKEWKKRSENVELYIKKNFEGVQ